MIENLDKEHLSIVQNAFNKIAKIEGRELYQFRDSVSTLNININAIDIILKKIDEKLNKRSYVDIAMVEESELELGEVEYD